ncbi:MAG: S9 family peptidase [Pseudomonadales bacterium]|nr:S9 family peptidase [Pseudomonadales bacterium]
MNQLTLDRIFGDPDINGAAPKSLQFSPDGMNVTFLKSSTENFECLDLWTYEIERGQARLLVDSNLLETEKRILSTAEKARRERLRINNEGIVEYYWSPNSDALLFPLSGNLYLYKFGQQQPLQQLTGSDTFETDIQFSPNGQHLSFVRAQNLCLIDLQTLEHKQLTTDGGGTISNGLAEFIAQEEMHRFEGYWWSYDSRKIAFTRVDESSVEVSQRYEIDADSFSVYDQRYPYTGTANAEITLITADISSGELSAITLTRQPDSYICRIDWLRDNIHLAIQVQSRDQRQLTLNFYNINTHEQKVRLQETSNTWINLNDNFHPLINSTQFIWGSERSGFNHLYLMDIANTSTQQLTKGDWVVTDVKAIDEQHCYFEGYKDTPLEKHLYQVKLNQPGQIKRISETGFTHLCSISSNKQYFIDQCSAAETPQQVLLRDISGKLIKSLEANKLDKSHPFSPFKKDLGAISFGELTANDGQTLQYRLIKPAHLSMDQTYPVIITVYGGPGVQRVSNDWVPPWHHYMAQRGYGLFQLDNRGSTNRGKKFEDPIFKKLGEIEVLDQLRGLEYLHQQNWVDNDRIGVFGHSYGGYMTLMMMMRSNAFKAGISVAPVTDWSLYDTHYTERYLAHPEKNPQGYIDSSVFPYIKNLSGKLLLIHGMADDNVLFSNSTRLYKALQDENIPFEIMNYPGAKHGLTGRKTNLHRYSTMDRFFDNHLKSTAANQTISS